MTIRFTWLYQTILFQLVIAFHMKLLTFFNFTSGEIQFSLKGHKDAVFEIRELDIGILMASKSVDQTILNMEMKYSFDIDV